MAAFAVAAFAVEVLGAMLGNGLEPLYEGSNSNRSLENGPQRRVEIHARLDRVSWCGGGAELTEKHHAELQAMHAQSVPTHSTLLFQLVEEHVDG